MVNIVVSQDGNVTGDKGKIIAYEGQKYSEVINIVHPLFNGTRYYIQYKYNNTILRNELDANNQVSIEVGQAAYAQCQFIAIDVLTGDIVFKSKTWYLIIKEDLKIEESHYPCNSLGHHYKHRPPIHVTPYYCNSNDFNLYEIYAKLNEKISNEEDIRFNEIQSLRQELIEIKKLLNINDNVASTLNANEIIIPGKYNANNFSTGFPETNKQYLLDVTNHGSNILQTAYENNSNNVYYRSTLAINSGTPSWTDWTLLVLQS